MTSHPAPSDRPETPAESPADDRLFDPAAALSLIHEQQRSVIRQQLSGVAWILGVWGLARGVGFLVLWSGYDGGNPWFRLPLGVAGTIFGALLVVAIAVSAVVGSRIGRGIEGASAFSGAVYGASWMLGSGSVFAVGVALARAGVDGLLLSLYYPAAYALVAGLIYLMGAALWRSLDQLVLGAIILIVGSIAPFFGAPTNNLVMALLGGGAFLVAAVVMQVGLQRGSRA